MPINFLTATKNAMLEEVRSAFTAGGTIEVRTGAAPTNVGDAATGTLLLTFTLPAPAFAAAGSGSIATLGAPYAAIAVASGTPGYARFIDSVAQATIDLPIGLAVAIDDTDDGTDYITTLTAHGYVDNQAVVIYEGTTTSAVMYCSVVNTTTLQLLDAPGGTALPMPVAGTYVTAYFRDARYDMSLSSAAGTVTLGDLIVLPEFGVSI